VAGESSGAAPSGRKPASLAEEAVAHIMELLCLADASLAEIETPVFTYGTTPLKVLYLIWRQGGVSYTPEIVRMGLAAGLSRSRIFEALTRLDEDGFITRIGSRVQVRKRD
jgi:hypothetical protein